MMNEDKLFSDDIDERLRKATGESEEKIKIEDPEVLFTGKGGVKQVPLKERPKITGEEDCEEPKRNMDKVDAIASSTAYLTHHKIDFWELIQKQTQPENILKTCYGFVNDINSDERALLGLKTDLIESENAFSEIKRDVLTDKELMKEWKEDFGITNNDGRLKKIEDDNQGIMESIELYRNKIKSVEIELACNRRLFNLHLEVLKKTNNVKFPYEL